MYTKGLSYAYRLVIIGKQLEYQAKSTGVGNRGASSPSSALSPRENPSTCLSHTFTCVDKDTSTPQGGVRSDEMMCMKFLGTVNLTHWTKERHIYSAFPSLLGFPGGSDGNEFAGNVGDLGSIPGLGRSPGGGHGNPLQYSCLENPHGQRSLAGYSPWGRKESDKTEWLSTTFPSLPPQCTKAHFRKPWNWWTSTFQPAGIGLRLQGC